MIYYKTHASYVPPVVNDQWSPIYATLRSSENAPVYAIKIFFLIQKIPLTAKLDSAYVQFWLSSEFFSSSYLQIGQHVVLLHTLTDRN